jgi:hypothetical protein
MSDDSGDPGWARQTKVGCLGVACGLVAYALTILVGGMLVFVAIPREPIGPAGMIVGLLMLHPVALLAVVTSAILLVLRKKRLVWAVGSGVLVGLVTLVYGSLLIRG